MLSTGTPVNLTWTGQQNVTKSRVIDLVDDLPHLSLLLLILQRFDDAKWGYFTECPQSGMKVKPGAMSFTVSSVVDEETSQRIMVVLYPNDHEIYLGMTLIGRGTSVIGGREGLPPVPTQLGYTSNPRTGNDLVVKIYWPEEFGTSELDTLKKAKGGKFDFTDNPRLPADGAHHLCIRQLRPTKESKEKGTLAAYSQSFPCEYKMQTTTSTHHLRYRLLLFVEGDPPRGH